MKSIYFTEQHYKFRTQVREFLAEYVLPFADQWEEQRYVPKAIWEKMGDLGLLGLHYPQSVGGQEKDIFYSVVLLEELGRTGYTGFRVAIAVHSYMSTTYIMHFGHNELKHNYLRPAILGTKIASLAITEENAGSDLSHLQTNAKLEKDHYVINGHKKFVANGSVADFIIVAVKTSSTATGISLLIVDTNTAGLKINKLNNYNWHSSDTCEITFTNARVPASNVLGAEGKGFMYIMQCMQLERIVAGILAIGGADCCLDHTWQYMNQRDVFGKKISKHQAPRHCMANLLAELESVRQLSYHAAWLYANADLPIAEATMLKLTATELSLKIAMECIHFYGGFGCQNSVAIARMFRDAQAGTIAGGVSEIMRDIIAQVALDEAGWRRNLN